MIPTPRLHFWWANPSNISQTFASSLIFPIWMPSNDMSEKPKQTSHLNSKSGMRLVVFPHYLQCFIHPKGGSLGFLNHQQYLEGSQWPTRNNAFSRAKNPFKNYSKKTVLHVHQLWIKHSSGRQIMAPPPPPHRCNGGGDCLRESPSRKSTDFSTINVVCVPSNWLPPLNLRTLSLRAVPCTSKRVQHLRFWRFGVLEVYTSCDPKMMGYSNFWRTSMAMAGKSPFWKEGDTLSTQRFDCFH